MASLKMGTLPALRRQHLLAEFSGLKQACPEGVFMSLTPGDPSLWSGVIFVRKGPYATAVLRFQISFPDAYPSLPPLVTFSTDIFHPLVTPLTTYMYTTDIQDNGTVSATDEERLPPGGFSLRHGFPDWFGRGRRSRVTSGSGTAPAGGGTGTSSGAGQASGSGGIAFAQTPPRSTAGSAQSTPASKASPAGPPGYMQTGRREISTYDVLRYIRSTFDDEEVLDSVPLEAAGNPGAWHAWRTHQRQLGKGAKEGGAAGSPAAGGEGGGESGAPLKPVASTSSMARRPGEWNWEGVWEERVKKGIAASLSEPVMFGSAGATDDVIRFLSMEDSDVEAVKDNLKRTLGVAN